jgi:hypothetical protein
MDDKHYFADLENAGPAEGQGVTLAMKNRERLTVSRA